MTDAPTTRAGLVSDSKQKLHEDSKRLSASVRRGAVWSILNTLILRLANILITAIVAHVVTPQAFGVFAVAVTAYQIIFAFGTLGTSACLLRADLDIDSLAPTMATVSLVMSTIITGLMAAFAKSIAVALGSADGAGPVRVMALALFLEGFSAVPWAQLTRDFKQDKIFLGLAIAFIPSTATLFVLAKSGGGAMAFAWSRVVNQVVLDCIIFGSVPKRYRPGLSRDALSILVRFGLPTAGTTFVSYILLNVDNALIGHLIGAVALGIYVLAFNVASWPGSMVGGVIAGVSIPAFSRVKHHPDQLKNATVRGLRMLSVITMPSCGVMVVLARPLVLTVYGARWATAATVLSILCLYTAFSAICSLLEYILTGLGKASTNLVISLLWLGLLIPAMAVGVRLNGIIGAAIAQVVVCGLLILPACALILRSVTSIPFTSMGKAVLPSLLGASAAAITAKETASQFSSPPVQLITGVASGGVVYLIAAGRECVAFLSEEQAARLRTLALFRLITIVVHKARVRVSGPPERRKGGGERRDMDAA